MEIKIIDLLMSPQGCTTYEYNFVVIGFQLLNKEIIRKSYYVNYLVIYINKVSVCLTEAFFHKITYFCSNFYNQGKITMPLSKHYCVKRTEFYKLCNQYFWNYIVCGLKMKLTNASFIATLPVSQQILCSSEKSFCLTQKFYNP